MNNHNEFDGTTFITLESKDNKRCISFLDYDRMRSKAQHHTQTGFINSLYRLLEELHILNLRYNMYHDIDSGEVRRAARILIKEINRVMDQIDDIKNYPVSY